MATLSNQDALFIDIDGTIVQPRAGAEPQELCGMTLLHLMKEFAVSSRGMDESEAEGIIKKVFQSVSFWHWSHYIIALDLCAHEFWDYAYECERRYLEPVCENLPEVFRSLQQAGYRMFITSNNPNSGICHKLRIAGLGEIWGSPFFLQYFGPPNLPYLKWDREFWVQVIAQTGLDPRNVIVIGDSWKDDVETPVYAGIKKRVYFEQVMNGEPTVDAGVYRASSWDQIRSLLLGERAIPADMKTSVIAAEAGRASVSKRNVREVLKRN